MQDRRPLEVLLGTYVAVLLIPAAVLFTRSLDPDSVARTIAVALVVAVVVGIVARLVDDLADLLASAPVAVATIVPPLAYVPYMILIAEPESTAALVSGIGVFAVVPGILLPVGGAVTRNRRLRASATEVTVVTVGSDDGEPTSNWPVVAGGFVSLATVGVVAFLVVTGADPGSGVITTVLGGLSTWVLILGDDDTTEVAVTDRGLRIDRGFTPWDDLDGYRITGTEIEFIRTRRYLPTRSFKHENIGDMDALVDSLERYLPRVDDHGRVEMTPPTE